MYTHYWKLADLHTHLYACIASSDFPEFLLGREVDWTAYQSNYQRVYRVSPPIMDILERCRDGVAGSQIEFDQLFVFGDEDRGNFDRFQAKYDMLNHGSGLAGFARGEVPFPVLIDEICMFIHKIIARQHRQNVGYVEHRMNLPRKLTQDQSKELILAVLRAYQEYDDSDIQPRLTISLPRDNPWPNWR